jgi:hypothetical protein
MGAVTTDLCNSHANASCAGGTPRSFGSLYRFFRNKHAVADALMRQYVEALQAEYDAIHAHAADATPEQLADVLIDLMVKLHPQARRYPPYWTPAPKGRKTVNSSSIKRWSGSRRR